MRELLDELVAQLIALLWTAVLMLAATVAATELVRLIGG